MKLYLLLPLILPVFTCCQQYNIKQPAANIRNTDEQSNNYYKLIRDIPCPTGYKRISLEKYSFGCWLRDMPLKKDKAVHLYDGSLKINQDAQFAVMGLTVGNRDLQQCADAIMRLRAEYLYSKAQYSSIRFYDNNNFCYTCPQNCNRAVFEKYLERVFSYCGTLSLQKQLSNCNIEEITAGTVIIQGGSPGHAVIVVDAAEDLSGHKIYLIAQSYMPAQEMHILNNPFQNAISPWYSIESVDIQTPEWKFMNAKLKKW